MIVLKDEAVFESIYNRYFPRMVIFARSFLQDMAEAEDTVQDVFIKLHHLDNSFETEALFSAFLYKTVRNRAIDRLRATKRANEIKKSLNDEYSEADLMNDELDGELLYFLAESIKSLPAQSKKVITSLYENDLSYKQTAEALNISPSTVKNIRKFALNLLKKKFEGRNLTRLLAITLSLRW